MLLYLVIYPSEGEHIIGFVAPEHSNIIARNILKFSSLDVLEGLGKKILEYCQKIREGGIPPEITEAFKNDEENKDTDGSNEKP